MLSETKSALGGNKGNVSIVFVIIVALATLIAGALGGYYYGISKSQSTTTTTEKITTTTKVGATTTATETADWKTYTNSTYGFSFKYPKDWQLKENSGSNTDQAIVSVTSPETLKKIEDQKKNGQNFGPYAEDVSIYYYASVADEIENKANKLGATTLDELVQKNKSIQKIGTLKLGGKDAIDVIWAGESTYYTVLSVNNDHLYKILFNNIQKKANLTSTEKTILSTFQFTK